MGNLKNTIKAMISIIRRLTGNCFYHQMEDDNNFSTAKLPPLIGYTSHPVASEDLIVCVCEILSRLPVKSLMRFKCVSKSWLFLIEKDRQFNDLYFSRSKARPYLLIKAPYNEESSKRSFLSAELLLPSSSEDGLEGGGIIFQRQIPQVEYNDKDIIYMFGVVQGLVGLGNRTARSVCIYNPSTRESTPWIKSLRQQQKDEKRRNFTYFYFGYDPATKEHKVLTLWMFYDKNEVMGEVLTVGGKQRKIDALQVEPISLGYSVYVNGSIYWYHTSDLNVGLSVVEFNCGTEKFRVISIPNSITNITRNCDTTLIEADGRLALLAKKNVEEGSEPEVIEYWENNNHASIKMYLLHGLHHNVYQDMRTKETTQSSSSHWVEETFSEPPFEWCPDRDDSILPIPGTDFFVVRCSATKDDFSCYYYNWKKKIYSSKVKIDGISSFLVPSDRRETFFYDFSWFYTSTENLLPVN